MHTTFSHRDPLTQRVARTVRETVRDPYAYSEGPAEPQLVDVAKSFPHAARVKRASAWQSRNTLHLHRVGSTAMPIGDEHDTMPGFPPAPAEACTDVGHYAEHDSERRRMQMLVWCACGVVAVVAALAVKFVVSA